MAHGIKHKLDTALSSVTHPCTFATGCSVLLPLPSLAVSSIGPLGLPLSVQQAQTLYDSSDHAPFGKGSSTVVDASVRSCRQVDASQVTLSSVWNESIQNTCRQLVEKLGIIDTSVQANLYKLVVYKEGDFFKRHRDTEKEDGMFATMVVQLPSLFEGGQLQVFHGASVKKFHDFQRNTDSIFYTAAFYADCEHELLPVTSGYRICLLYNILRTSGKSSPLRLLKRHDKILDILGEAADAWESDDLKDPPKNLVCVLEHQYTKANMLFSRLKGKDAAMVSMLKSSNRFEMHLALVQKHVTGVPAHRNYNKRRRGYFDDDDEDEHDVLYSIEDVIDSSVDVLKWVTLDDNLVDFKNLPISSDDTIDDASIFGDDETPCKEEYEEYTGNAGPTVDHWYHQAVLVLWPHSFAVDMACSSGLTPGIQFIMRQMQINRRSCVEHFKRLLSISQKRTRTDTGKVLGQFLEIACDLEDKSSISVVLGMMTKEGLVDLQYVKPIVKALQIVDWDQTTRKILVDMCNLTPFEMQGNCALLACHLRQAEQNKPQGTDHGGASSSQQPLSLPSETVALSCKSTMMDINRSPSVAVESVQYVTAALHTFPDLYRMERNWILSNASTKLSSPGLACFIRELYCIYSRNKLPLDEADKNRLISFINSYLDRVFCGTDESTEHIGHVWYVSISLDDNTVKAKFTDLATTTPTAQSEQKRRVLESLHKYTLRSERKRCMLESLLKVSKPKFVKDHHVKSIATSLIKILQNHDLVKVTNQLRQSDAHVPRHEQVTSFLRSPRSTMIYTGVFSDQRHARNFSRKHFHGRFNSTEKHCALAKVSGSDFNAKVTIIKTDADGQPLQNHVDRLQEQIADIRCTFLDNAGTACDVVDLTV